jgi:hypothetical protein
MDGEQVKQQNSLELLQSVYRDEEVALHVRMRAAIECLPFENPKLSATAIAAFDGQTFAQALDRAIERSRNPLMLNAPTIEHEPLPASTLKKSFPRNYRRF